MISILLGLSLAIAWGLAPVLQKQILNDLSPTTTMFITNLIIIICIITFSLINRQQIQNDLQKVSYHHIILFLFIAIFCTFIPSIIYYNILSKNTSFQVILTTSLYPIFALIFAKIILNEKITPELYIITLFISFVIIKYIYNLK